MLTMTTQIQRERQKVQQIELEIDCLKTKQTKLKDQINREDAK